MPTLSARDALIRMADQNNATGASNTPPTYETKNLPHGYAPAAVPFTDSTHVDREAAERDQEVGGRQGAVPTGSTETGGDAQKSTTTARKSGGTKS